MSGLLFALPQYFQGVLGMDAMGSGVRLLALVGGGMLLGANNVQQFSEWLTAAWMALVGLGMGLILATGTAAALSEVPEERSGIASALLQTLQKMGGPLGAAILGSVLNSVYLSKLALPDLPAALAEKVRQSLFRGLVVAARLHSLALLQKVDQAFVDGQIMAQAAAAQGVPTFFILWYSLAMV